MLFQDCNICFFRKPKQMPGPGSVVGENSDIAIKSVGTNKLIKYKNIFQFFNPLILTIYTLFNIS